MNLGLRGASVLRDAGNETISASFRLLGENSPLFRAATFRFNANNRTSDSTIIPQIKKKINNFFNFFLNISKLFYFFPRFGP